MTLNEYFKCREQWLRDHRHPKTVNETRVAVEAFCDWLGSDPDIEHITPAMVDKFAADKSHRRRQLVSNLWSLLAMNNRNLFPRRCKTTFALAMMRREVVIEVSKTTRGKIKSLSRFATLYVSQRTLSSGYANILVKRAAQYELWHQTTAIKKLFTEAALNAFLTALEGTGSPWTVNKWRQDLLTL